MTAHAPENTGNSAIERWVQEVSALTLPDRVVYCDGSEREKDALIAESVATGELIELNQSRLPGCYLHRSAPHDVARTEHLTFISTTRKVDAGPTNNWMAPDEARAKLTPLFAGAMRGRTMYVVPFLMGPPGSRFSKMRPHVQRPSPPHSPLNSTTNRASPSTSPSSWPANEG